MGWLTNVGSDVEGAVDAAVGMAVDGGSAVVGVTEAMLEDAGSVGIVVVEVDGVGADGTEGLTAVAADGALTAPVGSTFVERPVGTFG